MRFIIIELSYFLFLDVAHLVNVLKLSFLDFFQHFTERREKFIQLIRVVFCLFFIKAQQSYC